MATTIWKGHIAFGLVSFPVRLQAAARSQSVSFLVARVRIIPHDRTLLVATLLPKPTRSDVKMMADRIRYHQKEHESQSGVSHAQKIQILVASVN